MDTDDLVEFVCTLEPDLTIEHYFSGIHPDGRRIQAYGALEEMLPRLIERNAEGFGIFTTANAITPSYEGGFPRRKASQVTTVRCVFADWDNAAKSLPKEWPLPPSMIVRTSPKKYHIYWLVDDFPLDKFEQAQRGIAQRLHSDPSVIDLSREMRLPGFMHTKGKPQPVALALCEPGRRYGADEILGAFPYKSTVSKLPVIWEGTPRTKTAMTAAVSGHLYIPRSDGGYNVPCPWAAEHTTPSTASTTVYYPPSPEHGAQGYFDCKHAHCLNRTAGEYDNWMAERIAGAIV